MKIYLIKKNKINSVNLPTKINGNYWIKYQDNDKLVDLVNVYEENDKWRLNSNSDCLVNNTDSYIYLEDYMFVNLTYKNENILLYTCPIYDNTYVEYDFVNKGGFTIGRGGDISYNHEIISDINTVISFEENNFYIKDNDSNLGTYVNNKPITIKTKLNMGDVIFVAGLKIIFMDSYIVVNNPNNQVNISNVFARRSIVPNMVSVSDNDKDENPNIELYTDNEYFSHTPRLRTEIEREKIEIDNPPAPVQMNNTPVIFQITSMFTMGIMSVMNGFMALTGLMNGTRTLTSALPSLIMCVTMLIGTMIVPSFSRRYDKKQRIKAEKKRKEKYTEYLTEKQSKLLLIKKIQKQILEENYLSLEMCNDIVLNKKRKLWERQIKHNDFLTIRLGLGNVPLEVDLNEPDDHFAMETDILQDDLKKVLTENRTINNVPIPLSLTDKNISAIFGMKNVREEFIKGLILQLMTFHSYDEVKLVFLLNDESSYLDFAKVLPHTWSSGKEMRFFAKNYDDMKQISAYLETVYASRFEYLTGENKNFTFRNTKPYYFIITDCYDEVKDLGIISSILRNSETNLGFSLSIVAEELKDLPDEVNCFLNIGEKNSGFFESTLTSDKQKMFATEINPTIDMLKLSKILANIPIKDNSDENRSLPTSLSFLDMYQVGKIEQLNVLNRWATNNPTLSLQAPIGVHPGGDIFKLDLHEKFHGPHGLIAGSTGSGKSEFIITYVLSLALNYHPDEVQFVLIDYKGGGLAGAFENRETGVKLPHLAGTITNLDASAMNRSLASIESELKRRQRMFNKARESLNESTIDIYKYQKLYREGLVKEPMSHLFIISDEFAELKSQQPDFMAQLISTARIGRSLGVHLILATQKPSGVVNDQIWSNSRFRVCLKVQEKSDSQEMIKRPEAAMIKETGRFYLQVGYNELFQLGQSAWSGAKYIPTEKIQKKIDDSVSFVNDIGYVFKTMNNVKQVVKQESRGEQLPNIVKYLVDLANEENINISPLWLPPIKDVIYISDLKTKYNYSPVKFKLNPIIGEYDDPRNQRQDLLTLNISENGNTLIYGMAGSGKENLLTTIISSTIAYHSPEEVNLYIMDYGSETLKMFKDAPHVGDIVTVDTPEKQENLFKMLNKEIDYRKDLFVDYNGDMNIYNEKSGKTVPNIVVMINNYEIFTENNPNVEETLTILTREGTKYGIYFIITTSSVNSIRYKLSQNFGNTLVLQLNQESDYQSILGRTDKLYPAKIVGRGLVRIENVYEFQTAYLTDTDKIPDQVKVIIQKLNGIYQTKAKNIPTLPNIVDEEFITPHITNLFKVPIGVEKESLNISYFDFITNDITLVTTNDIYQIKKTVLGLSYALSKNENCTIVLVDLLDLFNNVKTNNNLMCFNKDFDNVVNTLELDISRKLSIDNENLKINKTVMIINGISNLQNKVTKENYQKFTSLLEKIRMIKTVSAVIIDSAMNLKKLEYETWYKSNIDGSNGIYIGPGIDNQYVIKVMKNTKEMRLEIPYNFGFVVKRGVPTLIKLVEGEDNE